MLKSVALNTVLICFMALSTVGARSQGYPNKVIRIVTADVGGGNDFLSRLIMPGLSNGLGQPVVVENRNSILAVETVAKARPDGYTLLAYGDGMWIATLMQKMSYDPIKHFSPVSLASSSPSVLVVHPSVPVKSVNELVALAKAKPGELNYASSGSGSQPFLAAELFKILAGVNITRVSYKGGAAGVNAVIAGEAQVMFPPAATVSTHLNSGKLKALAVTSAKPSPLFPALATVASSGLAGYEAVNLQGIFVPADTPSVIINRLNQEIVRTLRQPDVKEKLLTAGVEVVGSSPQEFAATLQSEIAKWGKLIQEAGIRAD